MSGRDSRLGIFRFALVARSLIDRSRRQGYTAAGVWKRDRIGEIEFVDYLSRGGPHLPTARRAEQEREAYVQRALEMRKTAVQLIESARRPISAFARVATACMVILALMFGLGLASAYAMPGDPLYSVKRLMEKAHMLVLSGGSARANAELSYADKRLDELKYVEDRGMRVWYFNLSRDAGVRIEEACKASSSLGKKEADSVLLKARGLMIRLEALVVKASSELTTGQKGELERIMNRGRQQLGITPGGVPGAPGQVTPTAPGGPGDGQQNNQPGTNQTQPGTLDQQQNGQETQPSGSPGQQPSQQQQGNPENQQSLRDVSSLSGEQQKGQQRGARE